MWRKVLIGLFLFIVLTSVPGCRMVDGKDSIIPSGDRAGDNEGDPGGEGDSHGKEPGKKPEWDIVFTAGEMFSGKQVNFPADFIGEAVFLAFYFYG